MKNRYRIVRDRYSGYEAQVRFWWWPFWWFQVDGVNTRPSVEEARKVIARHRNRRATHVVEYLEDAE